MAYYNNIIIFINNKDIYNEQHIHLESAQGANKKLPVHINYILTCRYNYSFIMMIIHGEKDDLS